MRLADIGDSERAADAVKIVGAARLIFGAPEVRQHVGKGPAGIAELAPMIVVLVLASNIKKPVDRARSAQDLAARLNDPAIVQFRFRLCFVQPIDLGIVEQLAVAERYVNPEVQVVPTRLEQQNPVAAAFSQPIGKDATG